MDTEPRRKSRRVESPANRRIAQRTANLPLASRVLYRVEHYTSLSSVAISILVALVVLLTVGACLGFPSGWVAGFEVGASAITLVMVFAIQHTQGREQAATQRKLDELLRALPGAAEELMMLEEAPHEVILDVEEGQRDVRSESVDGQVSTGLSRRLRKHQV
jgi:low affinity Fe/Cu permease